MKKENDLIFHYSSPLGMITLASDGEALTGLWFEGQKHFGRSLSEEHEEGSSPVFTEACVWLDRYFSGQDPGQVPVIRMRGTEFQRQVWELLLEIPYGETTTYGALASKIAAESCLGTMSARAVGSAVGRNPVSVMIPCHRVVGADGVLTGYAGGIERKKKLLILEGNQVKDLKIAF